MESMPHSEARPQAAPHLAVHPAADSALTFGPFRFDRRDLTLCRGGAEVPLPPRVLGILHYLLKEPGRIASKQTLIAAVWQGDYVSDASLVEAMSLLRQALEDDPKQPTYVQTLHRRGYRFIAPVSPDPGFLPATRSQPLSVIEEAARWGAKHRWALAAAVVLLLGIGVWTAGRSKPGRSEPPVSSSPIRFAVRLPEDHSFVASCPNLASSPDGTDMVYVASHGDSCQLYHRPMGTLESRAIRGTEDASGPFFSPDGAWLAFFAGDRLKKMRLRDGIAQRVCDAPAAHSGSWGADGTIVFAAGSPSGLYRVGAAGEPAVLTTPDPVSGEVEHLWPEILPDGHTVLYTSWSTSLETARIMMTTLDGGEAEVLVDGASTARYSPSGHLVFARPKGTIFGVAFDLGRRELVGEPFPVLDQVVIHPHGGLGQFAISESGTLLYVPGDLEVGKRVIEWIDEGGNAATLPIPARPFKSLALNPTGERLATTVLAGSRSDVWTFDFTQQSMRRLTFKGFNRDPVWTPDGRSVTFASNRTGPFNLYRKTTREAGPAVRILASPRHQHPLSW
ncbi:MAG: winged helix-turn-helix domain-containing protein, partial [Thermoanaerobaculia bacterium]